MKPSEELIERFRKLYQQEFGEEITREQAYEKFMRLVNLLRVILRFKPIRKPGTTPPGVSFPGFDEDHENGNIEDQ